MFRVCFCFCFFVVVDPPTNFFIEYFENLKGSVLSKKSIYLREYYLHYFMFGDVSEANRYASEFVAGIN